LNEAACEATRTVASDPGDIKEQEVSNGTIRSCSWCSGRPLVPPE